MNRCMYVCIQVGTASNKHRHTRTHTHTHLWDFGKSKRKAEKRGEAGLLFVVSHMRRLLQKLSGHHKGGCPFSNLGTSWACSVDLQVRGSSVPEPYQHTLKSLFVRCPLFRCSASPANCRSDLVFACTQEAHTHTHAAPQRVGQASSFRRSSALDEK